MSPAAQCCAAGRALAGMAVMGLGGVRGLPSVTAVRNAVAVRRLAIPTTCPTQRR